jgi:alkylation response protein AidB-like acyl-CoA dehydrogenase
MIATKSEALKGGEFLVKDTPAAEVFSPENFTEEQRMMAQACDDFVNSEILPHIERIDGMKEPDLVPQIVEKAGELGLLSVTVPEEYGGMGMNFVTSLLIADVIGSAGSFSTTFGAHTGIGTLPIQYYGDEAQKEKYLPRLGSGEWKAAYCLTEPDAGSDANSGKTKAVLNEAGTHYHVTGQKMWISNAGFADVFIVFARIEDDKYLTAFIVERDWEGISFGDEEKKLGIKGSSTRQVFFENTPVPVENMLSDRGNGFKIAVNVLNIGRIKLGVGVLGGTRMVTSLALQYATERKQFKQAIVNFGAIQHKLAEMAIKTWATETASYRAGKNIEEQIAFLESQGMDKQQATLKGVEQYSIECAIIKVHGSETLDYVVDEGVQIYGGMGFSADAPMERAYRDARISRIYEGTNEINRMLLVGMILKAAQKGEIGVFDAAKKLAKELMGMPSFGSSKKGVMAEEKKAVKNLKKACLLIMGKAALDLREDLTNEQEILMNIADMVIETYVAESMVLRTEKLITQDGEGSHAEELAMTQVYLYHAVEKVGQAGREALHAFASGDDLRMVGMGLKRFTKPLSYNTRDLRRQITAKMMDAGKYCFWI